MALRRLNTGSRSTTELGRHRPAWVRRGSLAGVCGGVLAALLLGGCVKVPAGVQTVSGVDLARYQGVWHEIARLDHSFERGLTCVSATYSGNPDGSIAVLNRGFDAASGTWKEARGRALPVGAPGTGRLKVSFFGPFYGAYNFLVLDPEYRYAMVCGPSRSYLWILARERPLDPAVYEALVAKAAAWGFPVEGLIRVTCETEGVPPGTP